MDLRLLAIPVTITGGVGGSYITYKYVYKGEQKESIKSKLGSLLLGFNSNFSDKWQERANLISSKSNLPESLSKFRNSNNSNKISSDNIKKWCQKQVEGEYSSETDPLFVSIRDYCTFNNKDKLGEKVIVEELSSGGINPSGKWTAANTKLTSSDTAGMSKTMQDIRTKLSGSTGGTPAQDTKALRTWCEGIYTIYFKGELDPDFKDAKNYCVSAS